MGSEELEDLKEKFREGGRGSKNKFFNKKRKKREEWWGGEGKRKSKEKKGQADVQKFQDTGIRGIEGIDRPGRKRKSLKEESKPPFVVPSSRENLHFSFGRTSLWRTFGFPSLRFLPLSWLKEKGREKNIPHTEVEKCEIVIWALTFKLVGSMEMVI